MNSRQKRKLAAEAHNKKRREAHVEAVRVAQDKIDSPEKYAKRNRRAIRGVMPFIALAAAAGVQI